MKGAAFEQENNHINARAIMEAFALASRLEKTTKENPESFGQLVVKINGILDAVIEPSLKTETYFGDGIQILVMLAENDSAHEIKNRAINILEQNMDRIGAYITPAQLSIRYYARALELLIEHSRPYNRDEIFTLIHARCRDIINTMGKTPRSAGRLFPIFDLALRSQPEKIEGFIREGLAAYFSNYHNDFDSIAPYLLSEHAVLRTAGSQALMAVTQQYQLPEKIIDAWRASSSEDSDQLSRVLFMNALCLSIIEQERPGIARFLYNTFGIADFGRYPEKLLIKQFDEYEEQKPYGVILYPYDDYSGSFFADGNIFKSLLRQLEGKYLIRACEAKDKLEIVKLIRRLNKKYGTAHKISFAIIGGHGEQDSIQFGDVDDEKNILFQEDLADSRAQRKSAFVDRPTLILVSCSTGAEQGIGQKLSELFDATVIAPDKPTSLTGITATIDKSNIHFDVQYTEEDAAERIYRGGQKIE